MREKHLDLTSIILFLNKISLVVLLGAGITGRAADLEKSTTSSITNTLNLGFTLTDGNSETMQLNGSLISVGKKEGLGSFRAGIEGSYGESRAKSKRDETSEKETTLENINAYLSLKKTLTDRTFASFDLAAQYDKIAEIDYRVIVSPGYGVYLVKNDRVTLSMETGPAYIVENLDGRKDNYFSLRVAERLELSLSETASLWQSLEYLPQTEKFSDSLVNAELGVEAALNTRVKLRVVLQDKYNSAPADGAKENDIALISGLSILL